MLALSCGGRVADTEAVTFNDSVSIAVPAIALIVIFAVPGEPRWALRPSFIKGAPSRAPMAAFFAVFLAVAIVRALV